VARTLEPYEQEFAKTRQAGADGLARTREEAFARFLTLGFPTTKDEEWRFTSVAPIAEQRFALAAPRAADAASAGLGGFRLEGLFATELVFVDGRYAPALSRAGDLPRGVRVENLRSAATAGDEGARHLARVAPAGRHAFVALNTAFLADGAFIHVPAHAVVERPIHVLFISTGAANGRAVRHGGPPNQPWPVGSPSDPTLMAHPRVLVVLGDDSQASVVESYAGPDGTRYLTNAVTELVLGQQAVLDHYKLQHESVDAYHVGGTYIHTARSANCSSHSISLGGALVRNDVVAVLDGEGGECTLNGLYVGDAQRLVDNHTTIDHAKAHCGSREIYKGILADRARGVFNGKIIVRADAQKTDAKQTNRALLLSHDAQINTKPQLEIFANDVKCTHGAAVGQLDEEAVFYLRSRGLGRAEARRLLIHAFAGDVLLRMPVAAIRDAVEQVLQRQLARALEAAA
jgi:Fe-S cluster assembly protein SufD